MPNGQDILKTLEKTIDKAIEKFNGSIPGIQKDIFNDVILLVKQLDTHPDGTIKSTVSNLRVILKLKKKLESIILSDEYVKNVAEFTKSFKEVSKLQNQYFQSLEKTYKTTPLLKEIQKQSIDATITSLTESGINSNIIEPIQELLRLNVTSGGSFAKLQEQLRNAIISNKTGIGMLERYAKQITTDSLNQFSAQYSQIISDDLGFEWYWYTGSNIETTRCFCRALTKRKYVHKSELGKIVDGDFDEFKDGECGINSKSGLPNGMIPGTNATNFKIYRGGYNCGHQLDPVLANAIPEAIRNKFKKAPI